MTSLVHLPSCISAGLLFLDFLPPQQVDSASTCVCTCVFFRPFLFFSLAPLFWFEFFAVLFSATGDELSEVRVSILSIEGASSFFSRPFLRQTFFFSFSFSFFEPCASISPPHRKQTQNTSRFVYRPGKRLAAQRRCTADELFIITHSTLLFFFFFLFLTRLPWHIAPFDE